MKYWPLYELCIFGPITTLYTTTVLPERSVSVFVTDVTLGEIYVCS